MLSSLYSRLGLVLQPAIKILPNRDSRNVPLIGRAYRSLCLAFYYSQLYRPTILLIGRACRSLCLPSDNSGPADGLSETHLETKLRLSSSAYRSSLYPGDLQKYNSHDSGLRAQRVYPDLSLDHEEINRRLRLLNVKLVGTGGKGDAALPGGARMCPLYPSRLACLKVRMRAS